MLVYWRLSPTSLYYSFQGVVSFEVRRKCWADGSLLRWWVQHAIYSQTSLGRTSRERWYFVSNDGSSSYLCVCVLPSEYTRFYPIQLRILVLLMQTFVLSVFFLTRFHCTMYSVQSCSPATTANGAQQCREVGGFLTNEIIIIVSVTCSHHALLLDSEFLELQVEGNTAVYPTQHCWTRFTLYNHHSVL